MPHSFRIVAALLLLPFLTSAQELSLTGMVTDANGPIALANVYLKELKKGTATDVSGLFELKNIPPGEYTIIVSALGYKTIRQPIGLTTALANPITITMESQSEALDETVVTGTLKAVRRSESPVPSTAANAT